MKESICDENGNSLVQFKQLNLPNFRETQKFWCYFLLCCKFFFFNGTSCI